KPASHLDKVNTATVTMETLHQKRVGTESKRRVGRPCKVKKAEEPPEEEEQENEGSPGVGSKDTPGRSCRAAEPLITLGGCHAVMLIKSLQQKHAKHTLVLNLRGNVPHGSLDSLPKETWTVQEDQSLRFSLLEPENILQET
ncbi:lethal(3)malignant brain tumor-like protein 3, partial [Tachysurus ichikawai]